LGGGSTRWGRLIRRELGQSEGLGSRAVEERNKVVDARFSREPVTTSSSFRIHRPEAIVRRFAPPTPIGPR
jgi:hypothetical protein